MKKIVLAVILLVFSAKTFAQDDYPKHQVNLNILNVIWLSSVELGYEHYVAFNQSIEGELFINDQYKLEALVNFYKLAGKRWQIILP